MNQVPVVIVGGGMAGLLLALLLRKAGQPEVILIEAVSLQVEAVDSPSFDARSTALSAGTLAILDELQLLEKLLAGSESIARVHVSRRGRLGTTTMTAEEQELPRLGAVTENRWLGKVLLEQVAKDNGIVLRAPQRLEGIKRRSGGWQLLLEGGEYLQCSLLVAADGARSRTRDWLGISAHHADTGDQALIANVAPCECHEQIAHERFLDSGPLALLPLTENRLALVWTGPANHIDQLFSLDEGQFLNALHRETASLFSGFQQLGERHRYPLILTRACAQVVPQAVVVGNAAHSLHPVAGQGFNLTARDMALLANAIGSSANPGELSLLESWVRQREADQALISQASRWLPEVFRVRFGPFAHSRQLGLLALDLLPGLRQDFARRAMGMGQV